MESYRTEEEQVEALKRWWDENGRSTIAAIAVAMAAAFGWQGWQAYQVGQAGAASEAYQALLTSLSGDGELDASAGLAEQLVADYPDSTYAQFAALHLAAIAVQTDALEDAETQLRWVLNNADTGSDTARIAQLRLARVLASSGSTEEALAVLGEGEGSYEASYAVARGDVLLAAGRDDEAREAYLSAQALVALGGQGGVNIPSLQLKLQHLSPVPPRSLDEPGPVEAAAPAGGSDPAPGAATPEG